MVPEGEEQCAYDIQTDPLWSYHKTIALTSDMQFYILRVFLLLLSYSPVYECAFLNLAIYRVFSSFHDGYLIQSTKIYLEHTWRVSIYNTTVALTIISVSGQLSTHEYQVKMNLMASFPYLALKNIDQISDEFTHHLLHLSSLLRFPLLHM